MSNLINGWERQSLAEEREVGDLLRKAGPRAEVPDEDLAAIKSAFRAEWQKHVGRASAEPEQASSRWSSRRLWALAAALALVFVGGWTVWSGPSWSPPEVAQVELRHGVLSVWRGPWEIFGQSWLRQGDALRAERWVETGSEEKMGGLVLWDQPGSAAALRLANGTSLRLAPGSRARLLSAAVIELAAGAVYVDSPPGSMAGGVEIRTSYGVARDIGTQFEVRLLAEKKKVRVRVREGEVLLAAGDAEHSITRGQELTMDVGGHIDHATVPVYGQDWDWVADIAPGPRGENASLAEVLEWVRRERGWELRFADPDLETAVRSITFYGDLRKATPQQALDLALEAAGLSYRAEAGVLTVSAAREKIRIPS